jgi:hypothetical protein
MRGHGLLLEDEDALDQTRDSGSWLHVAEVRLHRANQQWIVGRSALCQNGSKSAYFDAITHRRTGAVCLHVHDLARIHLRALQCFPHHRLLCTLTWYGQAAGAPVLIRRRCNDQCPRTQPHAFGGGSGISSTAPAPSERT